MEEKNLKVVCYGEVLFDVFTDEKKIGGAPLNVALRMKSLGCEVAMVSAVGTDLDGEIIKTYIADHGLDTSGISNVPEYPTGLVTVSINERGSASYEIKYPSAWDKINTNATVEQLVKDADVLIYGSLVCRDVISKATLKSLIAKATYKVFDVNLRKPYYTMDVLRELLKTANFVKFNDEELLEIASNLGSSTQTIEENIAYISPFAGLDALCVTKGKHGAVLMWKGKLYYNNGYPAKVVDTVGAGDSFLAALITNLLTHADPQNSLDMACAMGALVAEASGANPRIEMKDVYNLIN